MNQFAVQFQKYIQDHPLDGEEESAHSLMRYWSDYYIMHHPTEPDDIRREWQSLEQILKALSRKRERRLLRIILEICEEHERSAFVSGFRICAQLLMGTSESQ